jgi:stage III sporulation protein AC
MDIGIDLIFKIAVIGLIITVVVQILKKSDRDDVAMFVGIIGTVIVLTIVINVVSELFQSIREMFEFF